MIRRPEITVLATTPEDLASLIERWESERLDCRELWCPACGPAEEVFLECGDEAGLGFGPRCRCGRALLVPVEECRHRRRRSTPTRIRCADCWAHEDRMMAVAPRLDGALLRELREAARLAGVRRPGALLRGVEAAAHVALAIRRECSSVFHAGPPKKARARRAKLERAAREMREACKGFAATWSGASLLLNGLIGLEAELALARQAEQDGRNGRPPDVEGDRLIGFLSPVLALHKVAITGRLGERLARAAFGLCGLWAPAKPEDLVKRIRRAHRVTKPWLIEPVLSPDESATESGG